MQEDKDKEIVDSKTSPVLPIAVPIAVILACVGILYAVWNLTEEMTPLSVDELATMNGGVAIIAAKRTSESSGLPSKGFIVIRNARGDLKAFNCETEEAKMLCAFSVGTDLRKLGLPEQVRNP